MHTLLERTLASTRGTAKKCDQTSERAGINRFGQEAVVSVIKEFKQLDEDPMEGKRVVMPIEYKTLSTKQKKEALDAVNLIKEKRDGRLKGRSCANGAKQRRFLKPDEELASPTVSNEGFLSTCVIDAHENRDIATADVPGAYLHAELPKGKVVVMRLKGIFVKIMCQAKLNHGF